MSFDESMSQLVDETTLVGAEGGKLGWVYFILCQETHLCKIGYTSGPVEKRLASLQTGSPGELVLVAKQPGSVLSERTLHGRFSTSRVRGEWFAITDELRAYLLTLSMAMMTLCLRAGHRPEPWMVEGVGKCIEHLDGIWEELADLIETVQL